MALYTDFTNPSNTETDVKAINHAIKNILFTRIGSLPGKPTFGSKLHEVIFSQLDHITEGIMKRYIKEALNKWEPRITVTTVTVKSVSEYNKLVATIHYQYRDKGLDLNDQLSINLLQ